MTNSTPSHNQEALSRNTLIMSVATIVSRLTGFVRTWAMAFALGNTLLSSAYQVANNLPNLFFELVVGGVLSTAFVPVFIKVKKELGDQAAQDYASNLLSLITILLLIVSVLCTIFAGQVIWTQNFLSGSQTNQTQQLATYFFRFFAIQIVLYGASAVIGGVLNACRDYYISSVAPIFNNLVTIITMIGYVPISHYNPEFACAWLGVGTTLGVFAMLVVQIPYLKKNGMRLTFMVKLHDPALKDTLKLGLPAFLVVIGTSLIVSVQNAASLSVSDHAPSIIFYSRLWYTLPYAFLAVPISTTLFTELSVMFSDNNIEGFKDGVASGVKQLMFTMIPFALYLMVFSYPLSTLFHVGAFDTNAIHEVSHYLLWLSPALPFYAVMMYLNRVYSSMRKMGTFALVSLFSTGLYVISCLILTRGIGSFSGMGVEGTAVARWVFNGCCVILLLLLLRQITGTLGALSLLKTLVLSIILGGLGALGGWGVLNALERFVHPLSGSVFQAVIYIACGGLCALFVTYGLAARLHIKEASSINRLALKIVRKFIKSSRPKGKHFAD